LDHIGTRQGTIVGFVWNKLGDPVKKHFAILVCVSIAALNCLSADAGLLWGGTKGTGKGAKETVKTADNGVGGVGKGAKETVKTANNGVKGVGKGAKETVKTADNGVKGAVGGVGKGVKSTFGGVGKALKSIF
jgi:phage-related protein